MRALRLNSWKSEPQLEEVEQPTPEAGEVVIRVGGAGACHSDIHLMDEFESGMMPWDPPFTLGHENAGWVHELGRGVRGLEVGQPVAVYGPWGCGDCARCRVGVETYCENLAEAPVPSGGGGLGLDGGMAEYMLVPNSRFLVPLPDGLEPPQAAALTDAGLTPYHAIRRSLGKLAPDSFALVIGVGGLGHLGVQILNAMTPATIIAVDTREASLDLAKEHGAMLTFQSGDDTTDEVRSATGGRGVDVVLDFVGATSTIALGVATARPMGDVTVVGIGGGNFEFSFFSLPYEVSLQTTYWGSRPELAEVLNLGARGLIDTKVTEYSLDDANQAYEDLKAGKIQGRAVVIPNRA